MRLGLEMKKFKGNYNELPKDKILLIWGVDYGSDKLGWLLIKYYSFRNNFLTMEGGYRLKEIKFWSVLTNNIYEIRKNKIYKLLDNKTV